MRIPEVVQCDFCKEAIDQALPWTKVVYPLTEAQRRSLIPPAEQVRQMATLMGHAVDDPIRYVPKEIVLEICRACADGLIPLLAPTAARLITDALAKRDERRARVEAYRAGEDD
jgi:hypothetical protein